MLFALALLGGCQVVLDLHKLPPPGGWKAVAAGADHTCAIHDDGSLWCWGRDDYGQLGLGDGVVEQDAPRRVGDAKWSALATGDFSTCGIQPDGSLWCWGANTFGNLTGAAAKQTLPMLIAGGTYAAVSAGEYDTCAIKGDGTLWCWGDDYYGELGDGDTATKVMPTPVMTTLTFTQLAVGDGHACAIASDGTLWCWGYNLYGEVGNDNNDSDPVYAAQRVPIQIGSDTWTSIAAGTDHTCGVRSDGRLRCWGLDQSGQLGDGSTRGAAIVPAPTAIDDTGWKSVAAGAGHTCGIRTDGQVWCWGDNAAGQLAIDSATPLDPVPTAAVGGPSIGAAAIALGGEHTCELTIDHHLWCAGLDALGALGTGHGVTRSPVRVDGTWTTAALQATSTCAIDDHGGLSCWGSNAFGQLGDGSRVARRTPQPVPGAGWTAVSMGFDHTCGLQGTLLWCWGDNVYGELGDGTSGVAAERLEPTQVMLATGGNGAWSAVAVGAQSCAIDTAGQLWCWGQNTHGELGTLADTMAHPNPVQVVSAGPWTSIAAGVISGAGIRFGYACGMQDGALACWGADQYSQLGDGMTTARGTPMAPAQPLAADQMSLGATHALVVAGGAGWAWGLDSSGELGNGSMTNATTPITLPMTWIELAAGDSHSCGIAADHTLWCWGSNAYGQLGTGNLDDTALPRQVGTASHWQHVWAANRHTCALDDQHALWCWGADDLGQLAGGTGTRGQLVEVLAD